MIIFVANHAFRAHKYEVLPETNTQECYCQRRWKLFQNENFFKGNVFCHFIGATKGSLDQLKKVRKCFSYPDGSFSHSGMAENDDFE